MALTSTTADTPLDICSRALILIGADPISSFDDGTTEATVAVNMYEDVAQSALVNTRWRFATNQKVLNQLSDEPTGRYDYSFRANEETWPSYFTLAVEFSLAIIFATSIARDANLASLMTARAEATMAKARTMDSQQQTTRKLVTSRFLTARRS
jgi:hypothetical protein